MKDSTQDLEERISKKEVVFINKLDLKFLKEILIILSIKKRSLVQYLVN